MAQALLQAPRVLSRQTPATKQTRPARMRGGQVALVVAVELLLLPTAHGAFLHLCARPLFSGARAPPSPLALLLFSPMTTVLVHWLAGAPRHRFMPGLCKG